MTQILHAQAALILGTQEASEPPANSATTYEKLSLPERRALTATLKRCNKASGSDIDLLLSNVHLSEVRDATLSLLCRRDYLIRNPRSRGALLESLLPFAHEDRVQAYAMMSLRDPLYHRSYAVCAPAARILDTQKASRDPSVTYELIDLAGRRSPRYRDAAARIAFILLRDSDLSPGQYRSILHNARIWYADYRGYENPWLEVIARRRDRAAVKLFGAIVEGNVTDPREYPMLRGVVSLPFVPHEIALAASVITVATKRLAKFFGQNNNITAPAAALAAAVLLVGARMMWRASHLDKLNRKREPERLEALSYLRKMLEEIDARSSLADQKVRGGIIGILSSARRDLLQEPSVQAAARRAAQG